MWTSALLAGALAIFLAGPASAQTIDACEKIKDADAFNRCLAGFGPAANSQPLSHKVPNEGGVNSASKAHRAAAKSKAAAPVPAGAKITRSAQGRMRMEWLVPASR